MSCLTKLEERYEELLDELLEEQEKLYSQYCRIYY